MDKWIAVTPKNCRSIALYALGLLKEPVVLMNRKPVMDFSERGDLTRSKIHACIDFEIRDGKLPVLGFHDSPKEMRIESRYAAIAEHCAAKGG